MEIDQLRRSELGEYKLQSGQAPAEVVARLPELHGEMELLWDEELGKFHLYRVGRLSGTEPADEDVLTFQVSAPKGRLITSGVIDFFKSKDQTKHGRLGDDERQAQYRKTIVHSINESTRRRQKHKEDNEYYELGHITRFLAKAALGCNNIVVPERIVGRTKAGKAVRMYKKAKWHKARKVVRHG